MRKTKNKPAQRGGKLSYKILLLLLSVLGVLSLAILTFSKRGGDLPCANSISCIRDLSGNYQKNSQEGIFMGKKVTPPAEITQSLNLVGNILGEGGPKVVKVDLTAQRLFAFEGDRQIFSFPVSTGKWYPTPTGVFHIWIKLRYTRMEGGDPAIGTYYNLPNVPYVMFFYNDQIAKWRGFSLHGTYWHHNFGHPMSHGCVNMRTEEVALLYQWAEPPTVGYTTYADASHPGTEVDIYGQTPKE